MNRQRTLPIGAEINEEGVHFRVWAPRAKNLEVFLEETGQYFPLTQEHGNYFSGLIKEAHEGSLYRFRLDGASIAYPDPASRYQPKGPSGPSQVINPLSFHWTDQDWKGISTNKILYEMHIGTFTQEGTWAKAEKDLLELADLGISVIEMMPVWEFSGQFGWGYDGVNIFAPSHLYGKPNDLKSFIDRAHAMGIAVILDVVYNHFGPQDNYINFFSEDYFNKNIVTEWGEAINFEVPNVREFFLTNALYWIQEYHFDGLRIDATQNIYDCSDFHILAEMVQKVRLAARPRELYIIGENESQLIKHVESIDKGGYGLDALWNDDFHHSALVRLTGHNDAYYCDYLGRPQEFISSLKYGYLYQGQWYRWQQKKRGSINLNTSPTCFINFIENHDQVANSAHGLRLHQISDPGNYKTMAALMLLGPGTPLLFQGQEYASSAPFYYFADYTIKMAGLVCQGRKDTFKQFASVGLPEIQALLPPPDSVETFNKSKLNSNERKTHTQAYHFHKDLIKLRKNDPVFNSPRLKGLDGSVIHSDSFLLRFFGENDERLMIVNFGIDYILSPSPDPLLAPPQGMQWEVIWSSENERYGGNGTPPPSLDENWKMLGHSAIVFVPRPLEEP